MEKVLFLVCLSVHTSPRRGVPHPADGGGYFLMGDPSFLRMYSHPSQGGYPIIPDRSTSIWPTGGNPHRDWMGVPPGQDWTGVPPSELDGGTPIGTEWGYPSKEGWASHQEGWGTPLISQMEYPHQETERAPATRGGMRLVLPQEDFLVRRCFQDVRPSVF